VSRDPQQAYAAASAAQLAGFGTPLPDPHPHPSVVAEALIDALVADPELGKVLSRRRKEVLAAVSAGLERIATSGATR
jgi:hypothetical protein